MLTVSKLILWYLNMSFIDLATQFKLECICVTNVFSRSTDIKQVLQELPTDKFILRYHRIDCYALHMSTTRNNGFFFSKKNI